MNIDTNWMDAFILLYLDRNTLMEHLCIMLNTVSKNRRKFPFRSCAPLVGANETRRRVKWSLLTRCARKASKSNRSSLVYTRSSRHKSKTTGRLYGIFLSPRLESPLSSKRRGSSHFLLSPPDKCLTEKTRVTIGIRDFTMALMQP